MKLKAGCILFDTQFKFQDNEIGEKLIVLLNSPKKKEPYLFCRTTSQEKPPFRKKMPLGCQRQSEYFFIKSNQLFPKDTWLQLHTIFEYSQQQLLQKHFNRIVELKNNLDEIFLRQIKNCIKKSEDISAKHMKMILNTIV